MLFKSIAQLACLVLATAEVQPKANDSPQDLYMAQFKWTLSGDLNFTGLANSSVLVKVDLKNTPDIDGAPFLYHVHEKPAPYNEEGCNATGGHLDPYNGNPNASSVDELEVGDLSGRHGKITKDDIEPGIVSKYTFNTEYVDQYISLNPDSPAFIGGKSITFHYANGSRCGCANITKVESKEPASINSSNSSNGSGEPENLAATNYPRMITIVGGIAGLSLLI